MSGTDLRQRLVAILAADAAGYSRLMAIDERTTVAALDGARAVFRAHIKSNSGRVIDTAGDSVLAVFETAAGAVIAALAIQDELAASAATVQEERRMRFRIGLHLGDVIEKDDGTVYGDGVNIAARLQALARPGGVTVSESIHAAVRGKGSATFEDQGEHSVKNIPYAIRVYEVQQEAATARESTRTSCAVPWVGSIELELPDRPSIAVLAFTNMSGDPDQEYFTDGITEDIITELSRFQSLFVIARNSSFTYKGRPVDIKQVGRELGVRYVLEGSIRRARDRIRVTAQLIDAISATHLWAEKYDRVLDDIFAVQEEVTACVVSAIAPRIGAAESLRSRRRPDNLSAYEIAVRAWALSWEAFQKSDTALCNEAIRQARLALAIDAESVLALNAIAFAQWQHLALGTADNPVAAWQEGMDAAELGVTVAQSSESHNCKAFLLAFAPSGGQWSEALHEAEAAYTLNPQDAFAVGGCGWLMAVAGDPAEGVRRLERAVRLNPRDPMAFVTYSNLALANLIVRNYRTGIEWATLAKSAAPNYMFAHYYAACLHVGLGEIELAKAAFQNAQRLLPTYVQSRLEGKSALPQREYRHRLLVFLRIAGGLDDPSAADALR